MEKGPLCRFGIDEEKTILIGSLDHSIEDGRSLELLLKWIVNGAAPSRALTYNLRRYVGLEIIEREER